MKTGRVLPPGTRPVLLTFAGTEVCLRVTSALPSKDSDALNWANLGFMQRLGEGQFVCSR